MMGMLCDQERGSRILGMFEGEVLSNGLRRGASSAYSLMFYA